MKNATQLPQPKQPAAIARWGRLLETTAGRLPEALSRNKYVVLVLFSLAYAMGTCYLASRKLFWYDELFTVHISRLPDLASIWQAQLMGADANPPLLYELTRLSEFLLGAGHVAARLPAIVGFGVLCLCLYRFVSIRSSALGGFVSMLFPLVTGAYWYAYEARSYGAVAGFGGIALICWQGATMQLERRLWWLAGLAGALACAMLIHSYAVMLFLPIGLGELVRSVTRRRVDWAVWAAIIVASAAMLPSFILLREVLAAGSNMPTVTYFDATLHKLAQAYKLYVAPAAGVLLGAFALMLVAQMNRPNTVTQPVHPDKHPAYEFVALFAFAAIPVFVYLAAKITGAPFFSRHGILCVAGFAGLLGIAMARRPAMATGVLFLLAAQIGVSYIQLARSPFLLESSSYLALSTSKPAFMQRYTMMARVPDKESPIVLLDNLEFAPTFYYAPEGLASRLTYLMPSTANHLGMIYFNLQKCCNAPGKVSYLADFLSSHDRFLVYGGPRSAETLNDLINEGATVTIEHMSRDDFLASVTRTKKESPTPSAR